MPTYESKPGEETNWATLATVTSGLVGAGAVYLEVPDYLTVALTAFVAAWARFLIGTLLPEPPKPRRRVRKPRPNSTTVTIESSETTVTPATEAPAQGSP